MPKKTMKTEEIFKKIKLYYSRGGQGTTDFITSLDLTREQFEILADHENEYVRWGIAEHPDLPEDLMYKLSEDISQFVRYLISKHLELSDEDLIIRLSCDNYFRASNAFVKLKELNSLKLEDLQTAYDLINNSKYMSKDNIKKTFDYISEKFPELKKYADMFKRILFSGKKDLQ